MQGRHDWILSQASDRPWIEVDPALVDVARLGAHQLFEMRVPTHAAVSATVELGRKVLGESKASFLNAILRKISQKSLDDYVSQILEIKDDIQRLSVLHSHPQWIISAYLDQLGSLDEVEKLLLANNSAPRPTLVSWPGLSTQSDLIDIGAEPTPYSPYGAIFDGSPSSLDLVINRKAGVQDEGSQLLALLLDAHRGEMVVDFCAGAGGKTLAIGAAMRNTGRLYAMDTSAHRLDALKPRLARSQLSNVHPAAIAHERDDRVKRLAGKIDRVLVDAPCSGLGTLRRNPDLKWRQKPEGIADVVATQTAILDSAARLLKSGGRLVYATCSMLPQENEDIANAFSAAHPDFVALPVLEELTRLKVAHADNLCSGHFLRLWPHRHGTDGFFAAIWVRK